MSVFPKNLHYLPNLRKKCRQTLTFRHFFSMLLVKARERRGSRVKITYNMERLREIVDDVCTLTGVAMAIADTDHSFLYNNVRESFEFCSLVQTCPQCRELCRQCDRLMMDKAEELGRPYAHVCHAGLFDAGMPIRKGGVTVGYIVFGRVRDRREPDAATMDALATRGLARDALTEKYMATRYVTAEEKESLLRLLSHVLFDRAIELEHDCLIARATTLIDECLTEPLTVESLCSRLFVSKNALYKAFRSFFGKTVNEYVTDRRIARAMELLRESEKSAARIAEEVGLENYTYFTKLFKRRTGLSPGEYRRGGS